MEDVLEPYKIIKGKCQPKKLKSEDWSDWADDQGDLSLHLGAQVKLLV